MSPRRQSGATPGRDAPANAHCQRAPAVSTRQRADRAARADARRNAASLRRPAPPAPRSARSQGAGNGAARNDALRARIPPAGCLGAPVATHAADRFGLRIPRTTNRCRSAALVVVVKRRGRVTREPAQERRSTRPHRTPQPTRRGCAVQLTDRGHAAQRRTAGQVPDVLRAASQPATRRRNGKQLARSLPSIAPPCNPQHAAQRRTAGQVPAVLRAAAQSATRRRNGKQLARSPGCRLRR